MPHPLTNRPAVVTCARHVDTEKTPVEKIENKENGVGWEEDKYSALVSTVASASTVELVEIVESVEFVT